MKTNTVYNLTIEDLLRMIENKIGLSRPLKPEEVKVSRHGITVTI